MDEAVGVGVGPAERAHHAGVAGPTPGHRRRMSARRKQEAVLRLLRGEDLELLSRELGVTAAERSGWREAFLAAGEASLKSRPADAREAEIGRLKEKVGDLTMANELLEAKIDRAAGDRPPFSLEEIEAVSRQVSPATERVYGLERVTRIWGVSRATVYRHRRPAAVTRRRPGPLGPMADGALVAAIRRLLADSPFHGEGYRKLWARLRFSGIRTSRRRVLRLMREHGLLAHQRVGRAHGPKAHDGTITTERVDVMWGTDLTSVVTGEGQAAVFIAVDHCSAECVGIHASRSADRFEALEPVRQAVREHFGGFAKGAAAGLQLRHDHGSQYVSHDFQAEIRFLGIQSSPAFVREPEGNGCAERFVRVLKENLLWIRRFDTVEELRVALLAFQRTYNQGWIIERHGYRTPAQVRTAQIGPALMAA